MPSDAPTLWLMLFTLSTGVVLGAGAFLMLLRLPGNREIAAHALEGTGRSRSTATSGAGLGLLGLLVLALVAMPVLTTGANSQTRSTVTAQSTQTPNNSLATPRTDPNAPKPYQPANPAPDPRTAPTGSSAGQGADSGGRPEGKPKQ